MNGAKCADCVFFKPGSNSLGGKRIGLCRRYPAVWTNDTRGFDFPVMYEDGWCGEHKDQGGTVQ